MTHRKTTSVDALYSEGRHYPRGQTRDPNARERIPTERPLETGNSRGAFNKNTNQDPESKYDAGYLNDASGWVRGAKGVPTTQNETATNYPGGFDFGNAWRMKDSNNWHSGSDKVEFQKPGTEEEWARRGRKS